MKSAHTIVLISPRCLYALGRCRVYDLLGVHLRLRAGEYLRGYERSPVREIYLENCDFKNLEKANLLEHIKDIHFENVTMNDRRVTTVEEVNELLRLEMTR